LVRKIFKTGNSLVVSLPKEFIQQAGLHEGSEVSIVVDPDSKQIMIEAATPRVEDGIDAEFAQQVDTFINRYRPALEALAK